MYNVELKPRPNTHTYIPLSPFLKDMMNPFFSFGFKEKRGLIPLILFLIQFSFSWNG